MALSHDDPVVEVDGRPATPTQLRDLFLAPYGHFTAMQVRGRRVRGLDLHLSRLAKANRELFGVELSPDDVRAYVGHALGERSDASVRVNVQRPYEGRDPVVVVSVRPPGVMPKPEGWRLRSVPYQRSLAHIKHLGDFGQGYYQRLVERQGYDGAVLTGPDGIVTEGDITNVGFFDGDAVVWPSAPMLAGITLQLVRAGLAEHGVPERVEPIRLADLPLFRAAFALNARGIAAIVRIDEHDFAIDVSLMRAVADVYDAAPWDMI
jgi:branched-subunit amino acid aminotransferase/4-amino-4-deoxychorismate lyase